MHIMVTSVNIFSPDTWLHGFGLSLVSNRLISVRTSASFDLSPFQFTRWDLASGKKSSVCIIISAYYNSFQPEKLLYLA